MANPYLAIYNHNNYGAINIDDYTLPDSLKDKPAEDCPGVRILEKARTLAEGHVTFPDLFKAFTAAEFRGEWIWRPSAGGWNCVGLLDGTKKFGECKHFAQNLWFLARAPGPYGLGLRRNQIDQSKTYAGTGNGFVSVHNGIFLGLGSNVHPPAGYGGPSLYYWTDHKTVKWDGRFWDPCYIKTYPQEEAMAEYILTGSYARTDIDAVWDLLDRQTLHFQTEGKTAEKATKNGRFYFFRVLSSAESLRFNKSVEGPLSETTLEMRRMSAVGIRMA